MTRRTLCIYWFIDNGRDAIIQCHGSVAFCAFDFLMSSRQRKSGLGCMIKYNRLETAFTVTTVTLCSRVFCPNELAVMNVDVA